MALQRRGQRYATEDGLGRSTSIAYNAVDQITQFTDARGNPTQFGYGPLGDALTETSPERGNPSRSVNSAGLTDTNNDGRGATVSESKFRYDTTGRITGVSYRDRTGVSYTYDTAAKGNATDALSSVGQLTKVNDPTGSTAYVYDSNKRLAKKTVIIHQKAFVFTYAYDSVGRITEAMLPSGSKVGYCYASARGSA